MMKKALNLARARRAARGFSLVELMIVVVIIGILVAVATPRFNDFLARSADKGGQSDVRQYATAAQANYTK